MIYKNCTIIPVVLVKYSVYRTGKYSLAVRTGPNHLNDVISVIDYQLAPSAQQCISCKRFPLL